MKKNLLGWIGLLFQLGSVAFAQAPAQPAAQPAAQANPAGTIVLATGDASVISAAGAARPAAAGNTVVEGDTLVTGADGEIHLDMQDSGFMALRPNTRLRIVAYKADGGDDDKGVFGLIAGGFRSVTGWIGKYNPRNYQVRTATATIGIRGTDHEPRYVPEGSSEGEAGTYDRVFVGQSYIETPAGQTAVAPNQAGFVSVRPREKPRLLAGIPVFFRPSPHEAEIAQKHERIQQVIQQRREERRKVIREKRAELDAARAQAKTVREQNKASAAQDKAALQEERQQAKQQRDAARDEMKAARESVKSVQERRKALNEDITAGRVSADEAKARGKALREESKAARRALDDAQRKGRALQDESDARAEARNKAAQERLQATQQQRNDVREKRKALEQERDSTHEDMKTLQQQENKRFREELKADRKAGRAAPAGADTVK